MGRNFRVLLWTVAMAAAVAPGWSQEAASGTPTESDASARSSAEPSASTDDKRESAARPKDWSEVMKEWLTPRPIPKRSIVRIDENYCYPHLAASFKVEIVDENEDTVWIRGLPPEHPESPFHKLWSRRQITQQKQVFYDDLFDRLGMRDYYLDFRAEIVPPPFMDGLTFETVTGGLPTGGLWQMNFVIDDMNEDGIQDLVFPPNRKGRARPSIYLGESGPGFRRWQEIAWSDKVPFDYGGVATGDFDGDGHRDIVLAIHFKAQFVLYGDGAGNFERSERLPSPDPRVTSRAPAVADFNGDGRDDVAFMAELDFDLASNQRIKDTPTVWIVRNTQGGWQLETAGMPRGVIGDNLTVGDLDGDHRTDLLLASNAADWRRLVYLNQEDGWQGPYSVGVLSNAFHHDVELYTRDDPAATEMFWTFVQFQFVDGRNRALTGVIPYRLGDDGLESPTGPVFYDDQRYDPVFRIGVGDLTGDGLPDLVVGRKKGGLEVFVQTDTGGFYREQSPEIGGMGRAYSIQLVDVDADGLDDVVAAFAPEGQAEGGVRVWLTRRGS